MLLLSTNDSIHPIKHLQYNMMNLKFAPFLVVIALKSAPAKAWWWDDDTGCRMANTNPRTNECNLPTCQSDWSIGYTRELKVWISDVTDAGTQCDLEICKYDWGILTSYKFRGGCIQRATMHQNQVFFMHYKAEIGLPISDSSHFNHFVAPQVEVRTNCGDAVLIDRVELDHCQVPMSYFDSCNTRIGQWGSHNDIGWCMDTESGNRFGDKQMSGCHEVLCFDVNVLVTDENSDADDYVYGGHCSETPPPLARSEAGMLRAPKSD